MLLSRRKALQQLGGASAFTVVHPLRRLIAQQGTSAPQSVAVPEVSAGRFNGTRTSLRSFTIPDWFADAKFGIWSHWGPQSAVGDGDWYARNMYMEGSPAYEYHLKRFGPQSKFGFKDCIPLFKADKWDPDHLMDLYAKAGAKYFFSMGVHHDNFDMWNSKYQPRWNAVAAGPRKDIVGLWAAAARRRGLRFGVSDHLSNSFDWLAPSHLSDTKGPYAGVPYDGANPEWKDLYHDYTGMPADFDKTAKAMGRDAPTRWKELYFKRIKDLVDSYQPDLLYTDGGIPFEEYGLSTIAELLNVGPIDKQGNPQTLYFSKTQKDCAEGTCALDRERGVSDVIWPAPWQTDTCIGQWHYKLGAKYKSAKKVVDLLVDIVSKNGNLLLNFPLPASGELDSDEMSTLEGITAWIGVNGEGIFHTRPWKINGEGPAMDVKVEKSGFNESKQPDLTAKDVRFTSKGETLFAFLQGFAPGETSIRALGSGSAQTPAKVMDVRLLGRDQALPFTQAADGPASNTASGQTGSSRYRSVS